VKQLPLDGLIPVSISRPSVIQIDDPALVVLYRQLKDKTLQTMQGAAKISPKLEFDYILRIAALYDRLGCDLLALDLVKSWEFATDAQSSRPVLASRRRSTIDDISVSKFRDGLGIAASVRIPPTVKEESSLLDSFDFGF
jgi:RAVE protein 1 C terminal